MEIEFNNVSLIMNKNTPLEKIILNDVSFSIDRRGVYAFLGCSNSGKSAIGDLVNALVKPTCGYVKIGDFINAKKRIKNINELRKQTGYVFRNPYDMFFNNTVEKELEFGMKYFRYKTNQIEKRVKDALKIVNLSEEYLSKNPFDLSLSDAKKISIVCALIYNPSIIILDEITNGMSVTDKKEIIRIIRLLKNKYNKTIILLTKDTSFVYEICDHVYLMNRCSIVTSGKKEILENTELLESIGLEIPPLIEFVSIARSKNHYLHFQSTTSETLKEVYRNVY